ncbi:MAG: hypothetical protein AAGM12_15565 [Pseudomonadota bacterium]
MVVLGRSVGTGALMFGALLVSDALMPMPSHAANGDYLDDASIYIVCGLMIAVVVVIAAALLYLVALGLKAVFRHFRGDDDSLKDVATLVISFTFIGVASLEGITSSLSFNGENRVISTRQINASTQDVWQALCTATSGAFPRPTILQSFPQPVDVVVDEGVGLGAERRVLFTGREGSGILSLEVTERTKERAVLTVTSDQTPLANWMAFHTIVYEVFPTDDGSHLRVSLEYERRLAPTWIMTPVMQGAGWLAMDTLARDVEARSLGL